MRKGEIEDPNADPPGWCEGEPLKHYKVWSPEALKTVRRDLLDRGSIVIRYEHGQTRKKRELDYYLATQGMQVLRTIEGDWYRIEYKGTCKPLIVCNHGDCMKVALYGWKYEPLSKVVLPACEEHVVEVEEKLGRLIRGDLVKVELS